MEAGRGIGGNDALAELELLYLVADFDNIAGQLVTEQCRRNNHSGVISTPKNLDVGTASERGADTHQQIPRTEFWNGYRLDFQMLFTVEHGSHHFLIHL
jgi:hypothetical protein